MPRQLCARRFVGRFSSLEQIDTVQRFQPAPRQLSAGFSLGAVPALRQSRRVLFSFPLACRCG
ncbi:hypothetical protein D7S65_07115 [Ralstonia insidiosa]|nr:hypothetical protein [Ralstonia insidiosa]MBA9912165.1 hypothetical protein [Ralstonia insidiosa]MBA9936460.1 hypothetical protein [Ralstonia insidiosa]MBA9950835.1 hypothetical protein [Ralstonia insidiosa]MBA9967710.1 hypothetical protein [Ralstonia insidiosa]